MSLSMYQASVPTFLRQLQALSVILDKAMAHAEATGLDPAQLTSARLAPDMLPFTNQIFIATDTAKGCAARLAGVEAPVYADSETTLPELQARIAKTLAYLKDFSPEQIDGSEERTVTLKLRSGEVSFTGQNYLQSFAMPNFFFHVTTAYGLLRQQGVPLGKLDFLGPR
ncbi:DUF1993 domain-containing protein [Curvibacter sp. RS43]|uniref:DUF1993 domain-containing protein n=1 Tax=Curvibacter microcysteis TaxID=3026419 RepID=A0ABT5MDH0_9BURK|nr:MULTISPECIES: DUF1993 domain-containing protein [unclassified Curvibacter]MDD0810180.1 DUF1993 domain-containing protein [Curvibacter sp. RS43]MDD0814631.1 DUF1993 domain-containing protein [Curvibacter sp. HBC28]